MCGCSRTCNPCCPGDNFATILKSLTDEDGDFTVVSNLAGNFGTLPFTSLIGSDDCTLTGILAGPDGSAATIPLAYVAYISTSDNDDATDNLTDFFDC